MRLKSYSLIILLFLITTIGTSLAGCSNKIYGSNDDTGKSNTSTVSEVKDTGESDKKKEDIFITLEDEQKQKLEKLIMEIYDFNETNNTNDNNLINNSKNIPETDEEKFNMLFCMLCDNATGDFKGILEDYVVLPKITEAQVDNILKSAIGSGINNHGQKKQSSFTYKNGTYTVSLGNRGESMPYASISTVKQVSDNTVKIEGTASYKFYGEPLNTDSIIHHFEATAEVNPSSIFGGYTIVDFKYFVPTVKVSNVSASSTLENDGSNINCNVNNIIDNDITTAWAEGVKGYGNGEWVQLNLEKEELVKGICIANGNCKSTEDYTKNREISKVKIEFSNGVSIIRTLNPNGYSHSIIPLYQGNVIYFDEPIKTSTIKLTIFEASNKSTENQKVKKDNTFISEVKILN